jgi:ATP-binding protein involved in chromosome partitioning
MIPTTELARKRLRGRRVIAVSSGKGGVGKSLVAALLSLSTSGSRRTVLIDLDIHGMAMPRLFGLVGRTHEVSREGIKPIQVSNNLGIVSLGNIVGDRYVVLPGANEGEVIESLMAYTDYGDAELVVIDMPPGLSDELLVLGRICGYEPYVVTTPSRQSIGVVKHLLDYMSESGIRVNTLVVNMSFMECNGKRIRPFGEPNWARRIAEEYAIPRIIELPMDPSVEEYVGSIQNYRGNLLNLLP